MFLGFQEPFGDVYIPEGFEPPQTIILNKLSSKTGEVRSGAVTIADSKTIIIDSECYFCKDFVYWVLAKNKDVIYIGYFLQT